jgi:hypothetical protein
VTESKHTPGPWEVWDITGLDVVAFAGPNPHFICGPVMMSGVCADLDQCRANARLIAAAPELLEALVSVLASVPFSSYHGDGELEECEARVRAAISKALDR